MIACSSHVYSCECIITPRFNSCNISIDNPVFIRDIFCIRLSIHDHFFYTVHVLKGTVRITRVELTDFS